MWFMYTAKIIKIWVDFWMCSSISILRFCLDLKILLTLPVLGIGLCSAFRQNEIQGVRGFASYEFPHMHLQALQSRELYRSALNRQH